VLELSEDYMVIPDIYVDLPVPVKRWYMVIHHIDGRVIEVDDYKGEHAVYDGILHIRQSSDGVVSGEYTIHRSDVERYYPVMEFYTKEELTPRFSSYHNKLSMELEMENWK